MSKTSLPWTTAWIVGGSTGIGRDLAFKLAEQGVKVAVSSRGVSKLLELTEQHDNLFAFPLAHRLLPMLSMTKKL